MRSTRSKLAAVLDHHGPATTNLYLYRLSKSVVSARGGALTSGWPAEQRRALGASLLASADSIEIDDGPGIRAAMADHGLDYRTVTR